MRWSRLLPLALILTACGGGGGGPTPIPNEELFKESNAWKDAKPAGAEEVSPDEYARRIASGELVPRTSAEIAAEKARREQRFQSDKTTLQNQPDKSPALLALLDEASGVTQYEGDRPVEVPGVGPVVLFGLGTQLRNTVEIEQRSRDVNNALEDYTLTYGLLTDPLKASVPTPESLQGKSLADVKAALVQIDNLLEGQSASLGVARLEPGGGATPQAIVPGNGTDNNGPCAAPTNYAGRYWFPLKNFVSPMKNQASRGTCWAFTAVGALESRERVQNNNAADLSEQFLVNKVKQDWDASDYTDGYWSERALDTASSRGQTFPGEGSWTYNPATNRPRVVDGDEGSYDNTCRDYTGTCSPTAHQSRQVCTTFIFTFCSYIKVNFGGPGVASSRTVQVWKNGDRFDLNRLRQYLAQGHVLMASFPVYKGFMDDVTNTGVVSNYDRTRLDSTGKEVSGSYGGHAVQIVGFLSNQDLTSFGVTPNIGGGGYFIVKNSWGCFAADGGYYYVPADYVSRIFDALSVLSFDSRRSQAWRDEQALPGGSDAPTVEIRTNPTQADLRVEKDLTASFRVSHPVAKNVTLTVTSDRDGTLYNGAWNTDPSVLIGSSLKATFTTPGTRTLTLLARYGARQATGTFTVNVVNTPPTINVPTTSTPNQGVPFSLTAVLSDPNEADPASLCVGTTWSVTAPDVLSTTTGCQVNVTFGTTGTREVRVSTRDSEGATATRTFSFTVQPPPANPYPRITAAGVSSRELVGTFLLCSSRSVSTGATIDLRATGCRILVTQPVPQRYFAEVTVENPSGEALRYDWTLYVSEGGTERVLYSNLNQTEPSFDLYPWGNAILVTSNCRVAVTVKAPEASRNKSQTVWTGRCTYYSTRIN